MSTMHLGLLSFVESPHVPPEHKLLDAQQVDTNSDKDPLLYIHPETKQNHKEKKSSSQSFLENGVETIRSKLTRNASCTKGLSSKYLRSHMIVMEDVS